MQAQALASAFNDVAVRLASAQRDADAQVKAGVDRSTAGHCLAERVDELGQRERERTLRDKLGVALSSLSQLIDIGVVRPDGGADLDRQRSCAGHRANTYQIGVTPIAGSGLANLTSAGTVITTEITGDASAGCCRCVTDCCRATRRDSTSSPTAWRPASTQRTVPDRPERDRRWNFFAPLASATGSHCPPSRRASWRMAT